MHDASYTSVQLLRFYVDYTIEKISVNADRKYRVTLGRTLGEVQT